MPKADATGLKIFRDGRPAATCVTVAPGETVTVGTDEGCRLRLDGEHAAPRHAEIRWTDGGWYLVDLGAGGGTSINGWPIDPRMPVALRRGDRVSFGEAGFSVGDDEPSRGTYATRASIFARLRGADEALREESWAEFRRRYAPVIIGYCRNLGLPAQDAEDVLQEVMLGFFKAAEGFEYDPQRGRFRGYLKRATHNVIRRRGRRRQQVRTGGDSQLEAQPAAADVEWDTRWAEHLLVRAVEEVRDRVEPRTFEAFDLYARRGVPVEVVAERLGLSVQSVYQTRTRLLRLIRSVADELRREEG